MVFGPLGLATVIGMPDLKTRRILRLMAEQQGVAKEVLSPPAPRDPNKKRSFMDRLDDAMDPDRNS